MSEIPFRPSEVANEVTPNKDERLRELRSTAEAGDFMAHPQDYNRSYNERALGEEAVNKLKSEFSGKRVIDLGCGGREAATMINFAARCGATSYVGVDKFYSPTFPADQQEEWRRGGIEVAISKEDMLVFLGGLDDNTGSILVNGIDEIIIDPSIQANRKYLDELAKEIARVAGDNAIVGIDSGPIFQRLVQLGYSEDHVGPYYADVVILKREADLNG